MDTQHSTTEESRGGGGRPLSPSRLDAADLADEPLPAEKPPVLRPTWESLELHPFLHNLLCLDLGRPMPDCRS